MKPERRCVDCGVDISGRSYKSVRCEEHAAVWRLERNGKYRAENIEKTREYDRKRRAAHRVKRQCVDCGVDVSGRGSRAARCEGHAVAWKLKLEREYKESHREQRLERDRKNRAADPDKALEPSRKYLAANREKVRERTRKWRAANPQKLVEYNRKRYSKNPERQRERTQKWRDDNREGVREYSREYRAENLEKCRERNRKYRAANLDEIKERSKKYRDENPEKMLARSRKRRAENSEKINEQARKRRAADPEKQREYLRKYRAENSEKMREKDHRRNALKRGQLGLFTKGVILRLLTVQKYRCASCGTDIRSPQPYHLDHIMPIARGGMHDDSNLQCLCPPCNHSKGAKLPDEWAAACSAKEARL